MTNCTSSLAELLSIVINDLEINDYDNEELKKRILDAAKSKSIDLPTILSLQNETRLQDLINALKDAKNLEICFLIDITGSMQSCKDTFKKNILATLTESVINSEIKCHKRFAYIGYRERDEDFDFVQLDERRDLIQAAIAKANFKGGGDAAEDVEFGLDLVIRKLNFKPKVFFFF